MSATAAGRPATGTTGPRPAWRAVAIPDEHGGWGLTGEPVLLGLLVAPSWAGAALGAAAFVAFLGRTSLKVVLVDRWRDRWLPRSALAARIAAAELVLLVLLVLLAVRFAGWGPLVPAAVAAPLMGVELWFDMRSRSRRLVPELCGATGIAAAAAGIALAGGTGASLAVGLWLVLAGRAVASIPFARTQIRRLRHGDARRGVSDRAQAVGVAVGLAAAALAPAVAAGAVALGVLGAAQVVGVRRPPVPAKTLGFRQLASGVAVVAITAAGVLAT